MRWLITWLALGILFGAWWRSRSADRARQHHPIVEPDARPPHRDRVLRRQVWMLKRVKPSRILTDAESDRLWDQVNQAPSGYRRQQD